MKFSSRRDIAAPQEVVFDQLSDFSAAERLAQGRGVRVERLAGPPPEASRWMISYEFRGRERRLDAHVTSYTPPEGFTISGVSDGITLQIDIEVIALAPDRTRLALGIELRPRTLPARILVQSMKLTKPALSRRLDTRIDTIAARIERQHRPVS
ncbi:SRPBCC family protein [Profundibacterium mesophilum]|uniref:Polyketide cyclase / dehydrase and lipid transport domain containing protein n=1 Tax=Profundibacterium mesophilum KAUST100406-0324 TaxID=1037889 RepID=A0A921NQ34_9RHOB|nr:SRPBCC family protein [Profundibacterium mesophilum]KAF0676611.1 Polyketide cyclase / dehydrase and lipid transport domain containing protein [Profundibacterium mesophilum KAUST100406-0324]